MYEPLQVPDRQCLPDHPVGQELVKHIKLSIEDLKLTKVIDPGTDPEEFANRITLDIFA